MKDRIIFIIDACKPKKNRKIIYFDITRYQTVKSLEDPGCLNLINENLLLLFFDG